MDAPDGRPAYKAEERPMEQTSSLLNQSTILCV
jgi:hypothetical protein